MKTAEDMWNVFVQNAPEDILGMLENELFPIFERLCYEQRLMCSMKESQVAIINTPMPHGPWTKYLEYFQKSKLLQKA